MPTAVSAPFAVVVASQIDAFAGARAQVADHLEAGCADAGGSVSGQGCERRRRHLVRAPVAAGALPRRGGQQSTASVAETSPLAVVVSASSALHRSPRISRARSAQRRGRRSARRRDRQPLIGADVLELRRRPIRPDDPHRADASARAESEVDVVETAAVARALALADPAGLLAMAGLDDDMSADRLEVSGRAPAARP